MVEFSKEFKDRMFKKGDNTDKARAGALGGKASGESKRQRKLLKESLLDVLKEEIKKSDGSKMSVQESVVSALVLKASKGDVKAFEVIRDTIGEKPKDESKVIVETSEPLKVNLDLVKQMKESFDKDETNK